jgi:hypothetical protein
MVILEMMLVAVLSVSGPILVAGACLSILARFGGKNRTL